MAILCVMAFHFNIAANNPKWIGWAARLGWAGVDLFFVLSGFLITSILLRSKEGPHYFRDFYISRTLRIFPLYYAYLLVAFAALTMPFWMRATYVFYLGNAVKGFGGRTTWLGHLWSLAIEEQFYLVWPVVVLAFSVQRLTRICAVGIVGVAISRVAVSGLALPNPSFLYTLTPFRCDALLFGALVACSYRTGFLASIAGGIKWIALTGAACLALSIYLSRSSSALTLPMERIGYFGLDLFSASLVAAAVLWQGGRWMALARNGMLVFFGKFSYGLYMLHYPISLYLHIHPFSARTGWNSPMVFFVGMTLSVAAALISWNLLERPFLAMKDRIRDRLSERESIAAA